MLRHDTLRVYLWMSVVARRCTEQTKTRGLEYLEKNLKKKGHPIHSSGGATHLSTMDAVWAAWRVKDGGSDETRLQEISRRVFFNRGNVS